MQFIRVLLLGVVLGLGLLGCDDSSDGNTDTNEPVDTNGTGDAGDDTGGGEAVVGGSCVIEGMFCMTFECVGQANCDGLAAGGPIGCDGGGGTWSDTACSETDAIGMCREPDPTGDTIVVYYSDGMSDAAEVEQNCIDDGGTFTTP